MAIDKWDQSSTRASPGRAAGHSRAPAAVNSADPVFEDVDQTALKQLVGYNCRRAHSAILRHASDGLEQYNLRPGWYSVLVLLADNPGMSSREVCDVLGVKPPNLVSLVASFEERELITKRQHAHETRALGLHLTASGRRLVGRVQRDILRADVEATSMLSAAERATLIRLLQRIYEVPLPQRAPKSKAGARR